MIFSLKDSDKIEGLGICIEKGNIYEGWWKDGQKHGYGEYFF